MEPMLRFKADDGSNFPDWKEKALSEIAARVTRKNNGNQTDIPLTISSRDGLVDQRDYFKKTVASKDMSGYFLLRNGEFAYNKSYSVGFDYGSIKRLDKYPCGALSTLYICFGLKPNVKVDSGYLAHYFDSQKWNPEVAAICAEGARNHGLLNVPTADFFDINIAVPSLPEQRKIADLLSAVDDVISAQKAEVAAWEKRKKGVMQKLFSQEVRFKADDGSDFPDWEEKKFDDIWKRIVVKNDGSFGGDKIISVANMKWAPKDDVRDDYLKTYNLLPSNAIAFEGNKNNSYSYGRFVLNDIGDGIVSHVFVCFEPIADIIPAFWKEYIHAECVMGKILRKCTKSSTMMHDLVVPDFLKQIISVPSLPEQHKIADCLASLDDVIAKAKDELDAWCKLKKGLLQQMFV